MGDMPEGTFWGGSFLDGEPALGASCTTANTGGQQPCMPSWGQGCTAGWWWESRSRIPAGCTGSIMKAGMPLQGLWRASCNSWPCDNGHRHYQLSEAMAKEGGYRRPLLSG